MQVAEKHKRHQKCGKSPDLGALTGVFCEADADDHSDQEQDVCKHLPPRGYHKGQRQTDARHRACDPIALFRYEETADSEQDCESFVQ